MDDRAFDSLARRAAGSRRGLLAGLLAALGLAVGDAATGNTAAARPGGKEHGRNRGNGRPPGKGNGKGNGNGNGLGAGWPCPPLNGGCENRICCRYGDDSPEDDAWQCVPGNLGRLTCQRPCANDGDCREASEIYATHCVPDAFACPTLAKCCSIRACFTDGDCPAGARCDGFRCVVRT